MRTQSRSRSGDDAVSVIIHLCTGNHTMGNGVARLATPCFSAGAVDDAAAVAAGAGDDGGNGIGHILSFDGCEGPAFAGATIHGVLLPSNQSTLGASSSVMDDDDHRLSLSGSSSCDSSNSFSFRTLQPRQYSGHLEYCASPSATSSGVSLSRQQPPRTDQQILADVYATRHRRRCQESPLLYRLRKAVGLVLPCGFPPKDPHDELAVTTMVGNGGAIRSNGCARKSVGENNGDATPDDGAARVQWARGKAGEDRVHVVVSEEHGWIFVGIYDGFNGPDATDYLVANLYASVCRELINGDGVSLLTEPDHPVVERTRNCEQQRLRSSSSSSSARRHREVLDALARALQRAEEGYFADADARAAECPELAMMGSCVLVVLMKGADVYAMNVGDSRAVLAHQSEPDLPSVLLPPPQHDNGHHHHLKDEIKRQFDESDMGDLIALQLTMEHSTAAYKEVRRIRSEHLDDPACIANGRVKGALNVTRAFGAGYLKDPRWNRALLEVFRVDYVGTSPYITCHPFLRHHRLGPRDKFLILSSDGLYDYFTAEEAVAQVEAFTARYPDEDPARYLSHEILLRAARQAGMGFHELLEVQQGDRRKYLDDVSIIIISLEGKIWRSSA